VPGILVLLHPNVTFENVVSEVTATATGLAESRALAEQAVAPFRSRRQPIRQCVAEAQGARVEIEYEGVLGADIGPTLRAGPGKGAMEAASTARIRRRDPPFSAGLWTE
jgi:hypothetical protein